MTEQTNHSWRDYSTAYVLACVQHSRFIRGVENNIHPEAQSYHNFILQMIKTYGQYPTLQHMREKFNLHLEYHGMMHKSLDELADCMKTEAMRVRVWDTISQMQHTLSQPESSITDFMKPLTTLQQNLFNTQPADVEWYSQFNHILNYYRQAGGGKVCSYGLDSYDRITGGLHSDDYIVIYGNTMQGKSTLARLLAGNIAAQGKRVLYFTLEESGKKSVLKTLSTQLQIPFVPLVESTYDHAVYQKLLGYKISGDIGFVDRLENYTVSELYRFIMEYRPDVVFVDQIPHLVSDRKKARWEAVTQVSRELRQLQQTTRIPLVALTQANRYGKKDNPTIEESMGEAYAIAQDASGIIFVHPDEQTPDFVRKRTTHLKVRDRKSGQSVDLIWDVGHGKITEEIVAIESYGAYQYATLRNDANVGPNQQTNNPAVGSNQSNGAGIQQPNNSPTTWN